MLLSIIVKFVLYLSCEKNENKQNEAGFGTVFLKKYVRILSMSIPRPLSTSIIVIWVLKSEKENGYFTIFCKKYLYPFCERIIVAINANGVLTFYLNDEHFILNVVLWSKELRQSRFSFLGLVLNKNILCFELGLISDSFRFTIYL